MYKFTLLLYIVLNLACNTNKKNEQSNQTDTTVFYPYTQYIQDETNSILKNNPTLLCTITDTSGKKKIIAIDTNFFKNISLLFIQNDITKMPLKKHFKETVFKDLTTNNIVMNYANNYDTNKIKNVDVYLDGNDNHLKRIDIKVLQNIADSGITENLTWTFGKELNIVRYAEWHKKGNLIKTNIKWNLK